MGESRGSQAGPHELELHGWLRYSGRGTIRLGRTIGEREASFWILRVLGQPFGNQHRVCVLDELEAEELRSKIQANGNIPIPVTVRGILFSLQPGTDVYLVASHGGIQPHASDQAMSETAEMRQAVEKLVLEELERLNPTTVRKLLLENRSTGSKVERP